MKIYLTYHEKEIKSDGESFGSLIHPATLRPASQRCEQAQGELLSHPDVTSGISRYRKINAKGKGQNAKLQLKSKNF